jgi:hypothetical protein
MDQATRQKWIQALWSGKYTQGNAALRTREDKHCCLGVLCDITEGITWHRQTESSPHTAVYKTGRTDFWATTDDASGGYLPATLARELGITVNGVFYVTMELLQRLSHRIKPESLRVLVQQTTKDYGTAELKDATALSKLNDAGVPFEDIATIIQIADFAKGATA